MKESPLRNSAAETLREQKREGDPLSDTVERLAGGTDADPSGISQLSSSRERRTPPATTPDAELDDRARP